MKSINDLTIAEAKEEFEKIEERYKELCDVFNLSKDLKGQTIQESTNQEINHGWCIVILDKGFIYIGELITGGKFLTIIEPSNIRCYSSGKGLLWHAKNGSENVTLDSYDGGSIKAPFCELKHFIPTDKNLW